MTPTLPDLDNSQTFYARIYEAFFVQENDRYIADESQIPQKYQAIGHELAFPLAAICQLLQIWIEINMNG